MTKKSRLEVKRKLLLLSKGVYQHLNVVSGKEKRVVFILGCQRSGTSLMSEVFEGDWNTKIFGEVSEVSSLADPKRLRLVGLDELRRVIERQRAKIIILKPLVESQNIEMLRQPFLQAKAIWMYRHYQDVIASGLKKFGEDVGFRDLDPMLRMDRTNWRGEGVTTETQRILKTYSRESMSNEDAAALFWFARNRLFFDLDLNRKDYVMPCRYEALVARPAEVMKEIYSFLHLPYPGDGICHMVHAKSLKKGAHVELSREIEGLCEEMYQKLNEEYLRAVNEKVNVAI